MQDGKSLQAGTSHFLGQNFAKSANITFINKDNKPEFAYTTSWGVSTRLIGGLIMTHADDEGMVVPPKVAPYQVVLVPVIKKPEDEDKEIAKTEDFIGTIGQRLETIQHEMFARAKARQDANIRTDIKTPEEFKAYFANNNEWIEDGKQGKVAFVCGKWNGKAETEEILKSMKINIRCIPFDQSGATGKCLLTGEDATLDVIYARAY